MADVTLTGVTKKFGDFTAVDDLSMVVGDGTFTVLVGPSGCGKTTTLRMVAGLEEASDGTIAIGERTVNRVPPKDRDIAMVFQNYALYPHMDVFGNMAFGLKLRKRPKAEIRERVTRVAELLGIEGKLRSKPRELSGGQRQRVAVGRAIVRNPQVFLFDEPLSNLDAKLRVQMRTELEQLHQRLKTTTIYVTHDQVEAMTLGDRIAVMKDGVVQQYASPKTTYDHPANAFVAGFIGSPAMNFLPVQALDEGDRIGIYGEGYEVSVPRSDSLAALPENVLLGIRPEDFEGPVTGRGDSIPATVVVTEQLGHSLLVYADIGSTRVVASLDAHCQVDIGSTIGLYASPDRLHLFDESSGRALLSRDA